ncbi:hypothetical protein FRC07_011713 [Ceratobasidium sp. 392]|nr:hypothetical protein FRC07_011713 [Ceratobasidium sp. 392]
MATEVLRQHLRHETEMLSPSTLIALIQSTTHYLVWTRPSEKHHLGPYDVLPILLARIFFESHDNAQGVARAAAVALAAASFAAQEEYPSSEKPASSHNNDVAFAREKQAVELLNYYREHAPLDATTTALFVFGFFGLLNGLKFNDSKIQEAALPSNLKELMWRMPKLDFNRRLDIYSLQATYSLMENMYAPALVCMTSIAAGKPSDSGALAVYKCLPLLIHHPSGPQQHPNPELYTLALTAFCRTESAELQELCLAIIDAQSIPANPLCLPDFQNTLEQLCGRLVDSQTTVAPIAALHVGLLVAALIANDDIPVKGRLEALQPLTSLRGKLDKRLSATNPLSKSVLFDRLKQGPVNQLSTSDIMLSTTQSIFDFLEKGLAGDTPSESAESLNNRLKDLRDSFKPDTVQVGYPVQTRQGSSMFVYGPSSPAAAPAQVAQGVQYMPPV